MKIDRMPTSIALSVFSWLIMLAGIVTGGYMVILSPRHTNSWFIAILVLLASLLCAVIVRVIGNIAQMMFELNVFISKPDLLETICQVRDISSQAYNCLLRTQDTICQVRDISNQAYNCLLRTQDTSRQILENSEMRFEQLTCDSKDINQNIAEIKRFFEQIEKHLDLNK